jgi:hypothetical protein
MHALPKPDRQGAARIPMPEYRAYIVGDDDHFVSFESLTCRDDAEAVTKARRLVDGHDVELWSGDRLVTRLSHDKET